MIDDTTELKIIGKRLKEVRKSAACTRKEICRKYGLSVNTLQCWELGKSEIGALKLAKYLALYQDYNIFIAADVILNTKTVFSLPTTNNLNILLIHLKNLENSNTLFYVKPDGLIVYFNPQYKNLINSNNLKETKISLPSYLQEVLGGNYVNKILSQSNSITSQLITINNNQSSTEREIVIELEPVT